MPEDGKHDKHAACSDRTNKTGAGWGQNLYVYMEKKNTKLQSKHSFIFM
jgi:hypothetical protein